MTTRVGSIPVAVQWMRILYYYIMTCTDVLQGRV